MKSLLALGLSTWTIFNSTGSAADPPEPLKPEHHQQRIMAGWTVHIDDRLLSGEHAALGARAIDLLQARLVTLAAVMPEIPLAKLREARIHLDLTHGNLRPMQYHPSAVWLRENGYSTELAKCVHIPDALYFTSPFETFRQPMALLHELAHAYHDQVLGFDEPRILAAWTAFKARGKYDSVLMNTGATRPHYALTDQKEFFAEMTESYFGANDFFPFVAGELKREEPRIFELLQQIWGPLPQ